MLGVRILFDFIKYSKNSTVAILLLKSYKIVTIHQITVII